jgi:transcription elongation factor GreA
MSKNIVVEDVFLTSTGKKKLEERLKYLLKEEKKEVLEELAAARQQGDLSENTDYEFANIRKNEIDKEVNRIRSILARCKIIEDNLDQTNSFDKTVLLGTKLDIQFIEEAREFIKTITIVGEFEADPFQGLLSNKSLLALSILGKKVNDEVLVKNVKQPYTVKILKIY